MRRHSFRLNQEGSPARGGPRRITCTVDGVELVAETAADSLDAHLSRDGQRVGSIAHGPGVPFYEGLRPDTVAPDSAIPFEFEGMAGIVTKPGRGRRRLVVEIGNRSWSVRSSWLIFTRLREVDVDDPDVVVLTPRSVRARPDQRFGIELVLLLTVSDLFRHLTLLSEA